MFANFTEETAVAKGIRRIVGITGIEAQEAIQKAADLSHTVASLEREADNYLLNLSLPDAGAEATVTDTDTAKILTLYSEIDSKVVQLRYAQLPPNNLLL
jgi:phospholipase/lecithinase/hemolysin